jgi:hypothetical protein
MTPTEKENAVEPAVLSIWEKEQAKIVFLQSFNLLLSKHNLNWKDVKIDFEAGVISVEADINSLVVTKFVEDLEKLTGKLK